MTRPVFAWALLVAATVVSAVLGLEHHLRHSDGVVCALLGLAFAKVLVVGWEFIELRTAAPWLRNLFCGWVAIVATSLIVLVLAL